MKAVTGWWFSAGKVLPHGDNRKIRLGITHHVDGDIVLCQHGLHLSVRPLDALKYATSPIIWRVRGSGVIVAGSDKCACSDRTYLAGGIDVTDVLRKFARLCVLDVIHLWKAPDVVVKYLRTGDENLRAATSVLAGAAGAAGAAAFAAFWDATGDATGTVTRAAGYAGAAGAAFAAAGDAAFDAAFAAAFAAAGAAGYASRAAAGTKQNSRLNRMLLHAIRGARHRR